jgi:hypothetical protein
MRFEAGDTVVRRDVFRGKVWSAHALRVIQDTPEVLVAGCLPGAELMAATTWLQWLLTGDDVISEADHRAVEHARDQAVAMIENREGPFQQNAGWTTWRSEPSWCAPVLAGNALTADLA